MRIDSRFYWHCLASLLILALPAAVHAGCSRAIRVPAAPTGASVIVNGDAVSGAIPDALRELGARLGCTFAFPVMPRARVTYQFMESGEADVLVSASRSIERDKVATFVPLMKWKAGLITAKRSGIKADSVGSLLPQDDQRALQALVASLGKGILWRHFNQYYPPEQLAYAVIPR